MIVDGNFINAADTVNPTGYARDQIANVILGPSQATVDPNWNTNAYTKPCYSRRLRLLRSPHRLVPRRLLLRGRRYRWLPRRLASRTATRQAGSTPRPPALHVKPAWVDYTGTDSLYSVAVTSDAVYVGGHYRWLNNPYGQDNPQSGAVPRPGLAALNPANGVPLSWNPGRNPRGHGAEDRSTRRQPVSGSARDTDWIGNYAYKRQKLAFFPFAGGTAAAGTTPATRARSSSAVRMETPSPPTLSTRRQAPALSPAPSRATAAASTGDAVQGAFVLNGRIWYGQGGKFYYVDVGRRQRLRCPATGRPVQRPVLGRRRQRFVAERHDLPGQGRGLLRRTPERDRHVLCQPAPFTTRSPGNKSPLQPGVLARHDDSRWPTTRSPAASSALSRTRSFPRAEPVDFSNAGGMFVADRIPLVRHQVRRRAAQGRPGTAPPYGGRQRRHLGDRKLGRQRGLRLADRRPRPQPRAAFTVSCPDATCYFDASASTAPGSTITSYSVELR